MSQMAVFQQRIAALLDAAAERRAEEQVRRQEAMQQMEPRRVRFDEISRDWMDGFVVPRLQALAEALSPFGQVECLAGGSIACLTFHSSADSPVAASLRVSVVERFLTQGGIRVRSGA